MINKLFAVSINSIPELIPIMCLSATLVTLRVFMFNFLIYVEITCELMIFLGFKYKNHLLRVRKIMCFGLKCLFWLPQIQQEMS